jgi:hypothetical protein
MDIQLLRQPAIARPSPAKNPMLLVDKGREDHAELRR